VRWIRLALGLVLVLAAVTLIAITIFDEMVAASMANLSKETGIPIEVSTTWIGWLMPVLAIACLISGLFILLSKKKDP
jgi:hypothetical protein